MPFEAIPDTLPGDASTIMEVDWTVASRTSVFGSVAAEPANGRSMVGCSPTLAVGPQMDKRIIRVGPMPRSREPRNIPASLVAVPQQD
jgi:hypothetical protein